MIQQIPLGPVSITVLFLPFYFILFYFLEQALPQDLCVTRDDLELLSLQLCFNLPRAVIEGGNMAGFMQ